MLFGCLCQVPIRKYISESKYCHRYGAHLGVSLHRIACARKKPDRISTHCQLRVTSTDITVHY